MARKVHHSGATLSAAEAMRAAGDRKESIPVSWEETQSYTHSPPTLLLTAQKLEGGSTSGDSELSPLLLSAPGAVLCGTQDACYEATQGLVWYWHLWSPPTSARVLTKTGLEREQIKA